MNTAGYTSTEERPVILEETTGADGVRLVVVGLSDRAVSVSYRLDAQGGDGRNANRASQSGTANLSPHQRSTLIDLHFSTTGTWTAKLSVSVEGGERYEIDRSGTKR